MNSDDSRIIARFQRLTTELLAAKRLGQWHPELVDELYRTSLELEQRGLKKSPEYRNAMLRADQQAWRLVEWAKINGSASPPISPPEHPASSTEATESSAGPPSSAGPASPPVSPAEHPDSSTEATQSSEGPPLSPGGPVRE